MSTNWKYISSAAGRYFGMMARASAPGAGTLGFYLLGIKTTNTLVIAEVTGAGTTDLATAAINNLAAQDLINLEAWIITSYDGNTQNIVLNYNYHATVTTNPPAAAYNLAAVFDPCSIDVTVDGGAPHTVTFASGDPIVVANGGFGALTNAGVAEVINSQISAFGATAFVPAGTQQTSITTNTPGSTGRILVSAGAPDDANSVLLFPTSVRINGNVQARVANNNRLHGFSGLTGGRGGNTAQWARSFRVDGV
jgi:hypothetical protein